MFRSPIAKALFNKNPVPGWWAYSYGTAVKVENRQGVKLSDWGEGIGIAINEMKKHGVDISDEFCDQILPEHLEGADKVIVMSEIEYTPKWLQEKEYERWEVPNPDFVTQEIVEEVINMISVKIDKLKKTLQ